MRYSRRTSNYQERITLSDLTYVMSMFDLVAIGVDILRINSRCSLQKELIELIHINLLVILYLTVN